MPHHTDHDSNLMIYRNDPKFSDKYAWANSADPDLHRLDSLLYGRAKLFKF